MKQSAIRFLLLALLLAVKTNIYAERFEVNGINYQITSSSTVEVRSSKTQYYGNIVIPESVNYNGKTYSVTAIGWNAFFRCFSLNSVTIPNSVTSIKDSAFGECSSLASITIPNSVTSIGGSAFEYCSSLASVTIPNSVISIGGGAFEYCSSLSSVTILNGVTSIGDRTFWNCSSLASVTIPNSVISIGDGAFKGCSSLTSVNIGNGVTSIGGSAFEGCSSLTSVNIGNGVTSIGGSAFEGCSSLASVTIPNSVISIGGGAFKGCCCLASVTIPNSVSSIGNGAFKGCSSLTSVNIGNGVTSIGGSAFEGCSSLTSVNIGNGVTSIGGSAFEGCSSLASVTIPNSVTSIGGGAFGGCGNFTIQIESQTPVELKSSIFYNSLVSLEVPIGSTVAYARSDYWNEALMIYANDKGKNYYPILPINNHIGETFLSIDGFSDEGMEISEDEYVKVQLSNGNIIPYSMVLKGDCEITDFFANGEYSYKPVANYRQNIISTYSYHHYKDISLSESGTLIDVIGIDNLDKMECLKVRGNINGTDILTIRKMKNLKLLDLSDAHVVNGGMSYYENYKSSENIIGEHFYDGLKRVLRIKLPLDIEAIKHDAFSGCDSCIVIYVPKTVKDYATSLTVPLYNLRSIQIEDLSAWCNMKPRFYITWHVHNYHLVLNDREITDLVIPENIHELNRYAFKGCAWIKSLTLPSAVTSIEEWAFYGCKSLTSVTSFNPTPPEIAKEIFEKDAYENSTLYVPKGSKTLYWLHPYWEKFKNIVELGDTGINDVTVDQHQQREGVYTIDGVKLSSNAGNTDNLPKGIYIINGQKVVIK